MKFKFIITLLVLFTSKNFVFAQQDIFIDASFKEVSKATFMNKYHSKLFLVATAHSDTAIYRKLIFKEYFGVIDASKKQQLNKLFSTRYSIDTTKIWLIHYADSLPDVKLMPAKSHIKYTDSTKKSHIHLLSFSDDKEIIPKELKKYRKHKNVRLLHFYKNDFGYPLKSEDYTWLQDPNSILHLIFSDGLVTYKNIILYPDGNFFVRMVYISAQEEARLFRKRYFNKRKNKFNKKYAKTLNQ